MTTPTTTDTSAPQESAGTSPAGRLVRLEEALARHEPPPSGALSGVDDGIARLCAVAGVVLDADAVVYERRAGEELAMAARWSVRPDCATARPDTLRAALEAIRRAALDPRAPATPVNSPDSRGGDPARRIAARAVRSEGSIAGALVLTGGAGLLSGPEDDAALALVAGMIGREESRRRIAAALMTCEDQLRHMQKVDSVGRLASGLAHDINNWASTILGHAGVLSVGIAAKDPLQEPIEEIKRAAKHASTLTSQVLSFSRRRGAGPHADLDLNLVVAGMERMLRPMLPTQLRLATVLPASIGRVRAERGGVEQVLMNLVLNARDAMQDRPGGRITIETFEDEVSSSRAESLVLPRAGRFVACAVRDEGLGMDAATRARVFEPFFTTKAPGKGTGLGLSTAWSIVRELGGAIDVESSPGAGACFTVRLPRAVDITPQDPRDQGGAARLRGRGETVLVVEDDDGVRAVIGRILAGAGYRLLEARDGEEAIVVARKHLGPIDLLLVDAVLPGISGRTLAERIQYARRETRVLYMSGYPDHVARERDIIDPAKAFIAKPFAPALLLAKVRETLEARALEESV